MIWNDKRTTYDLRHGTLTITHEDADILVTALWDSLATDRGIHADHGYRSRMGDGYAEKLALLDMFEEPRSGAEHGSFWSAYSGGAQAMQLAETYRDFAEFCEDDPRAA